MKQGKLQQIVYLIFLLYYCYIMSYQLFLQSDSLLQGAWYFLKNNTRLQLQSHKRVTFERRYVLDIHVLLGTARYHIQVVFVLYTPYVDQVIVIEFGSQYLGSRCVQFHSYLCCCGFAHQQTVIKCELPLCLGYIVFCKIFDIFHSIHIYFTYLKRLV